MKKLVLVFAILAAGSWSASAQTPAATLPPASTATPAVVSSAAPLAPAITPPPATTPIVTITATVSPAPDVDDDIDQQVAKKVRKHFHVSIGDHEVDDDAAWMAVPIVSIVFLALFGTPVLIVVVILFFSTARNRAMHKTVRMMVEKGQPVPESLLNPSPVVRRRSDLRRGIKWLLWGVGLMIFFGACSDWDGGAWSIGIIPFLIGIAHIIFWRLDLKKEDPAPKV